LFDLQRIAPGRSAEARDSLSESDPKVTGGLHADADEGNQATGNSDARRQTPDATQNHQLE
jgi:hypothetical protein